jgi:hypothetical protein
VFHFAERESLMKLYTSSFRARHKFMTPDLVPICIARWAPSWKGRKELRLAPLPAARKAATEEEYNRIFFSQLAALDPAEIAATLGDGAVLICYEPPGFRCHRRAVAEWLEQALGIEVPELGFPRKLVLPYADAPYPDDAPETLPWGSECDHCDKRSQVPLGLKSLLCPHCGRVFEITWD